MQKLFVGNVNYASQEEELFDFFVQHGHTPLKVAIPTDRESGQPRGFAFVEVDDGPGAVEACNDQEFLGRVIRVEISKPSGRQERGGRERW